MQKDNLKTIYLVDSSRWMSLSLGFLQSYLQADSENLKSSYRFEYITKEFVPFALKLAEKSRPGIWLFSNYIWNIDVNLEISNAVKEFSPENITIHGGPSSPKYENAAKQFLQSNQHIDIMVRGEGELTISELAQSLEPNLGLKPDLWLPELQGIAGISINTRLDSENIIRTPERKRIEDLNIVPSPYLNGVYDNSSNFNAAILETNRGCPYGCTFCDWGSMTQQKIKQFELQRVKDEINYLAKKKVKTIFVADANFGIFERDIEIAEEIAIAKDNYGYPQEVIATYAKNATVRIAEIIKIWNKAGLTSQGVISIQTQDEQTLKDVKRSNIKSKKYEELAATFRREGLPLGTDLMIGLPGATVDSLKNDLQYYFERDVFAKVYKTRLLPNSPMADPEYIKEHKIVVDDDDIVISTYSYSAEDFEIMLQMSNYYELFEKYAFLRYLLRYLQIEHSIMAMDFLLDFTRNAQHYPVIKKLSESMWVKNDLLELYSKCDNEFYAEVERFLVRQYSITIDSALECVFKFNRSVMPNLDLVYPMTITLKHDLIQYFTDNHLNKKLIMPLIEYCEKTISIKDAENIIDIEVEDIQMNTHQIFWELDNPLRAARSAPHFVPKSTKIRRALSAQ